MRKIKFRAFDRKTGDMFPVHEMQWNSEGELNFFKGRYDYEKDTYTVGGGNPNKMTGTANHEDGLVKRFEIMQFTGLKDKNGKEIYEGDIVQFKSVRDITERYEVEYTSYGEWAIGVHRLAMRFKACEVIGNIHENPELLGDLD